MLYRLFRPILFLLPPELAHHLTLETLKLYEIIVPYKNRPRPTVVRVMGINFPSRVGLAAGLDKNADYIPGLASCGFGFVEVGTVTPFPQSGNEGARVFRLVKDRAIINRMGFPNLGVDHAIQQITALKERPILGINIGKNASTPIEEATTDYLICFQKVYAYADYVTINISSPNTEHLRELQEQNHLFDLLTRLKQEQRKLAAQHGRHVPLVVKISPDLNAEQLEMMAQVFLGTEIDGIIVSNTTLAREGLRDLTGALNQGGLSGAPLFEKSTEIIKLLNGYLKGRIPLIAAGGIMSAEDAEEKLKAGAVLVQLYTGLIYQGPGLIHEVSQAID